ncbi:MAG: MerR family DNA-binding transcriptional regulator [bacterium]
MKKYMRIGEVAKFCGVAKTTIRHYTDIGILPFEGKTPSGHRLYAARKTLVRVQIIKSASRPRSTLKDVKERLK